MRILLLFYLIKPLKFAAIFNSVTDVLIFTIDHPKVLISFNSGTFDFFFLKMPSTVGVKFKTA